jgi:hypothetical protein
MDSAPRGVFVPAEGVQGVGNVQAGRVSDWQRGVIPQPLGLPGPAAEMCRFCSVTFSEGNGVGEADRPLPGARSQTADTAGLKSAVPTERIRGWGDRSLCWTHELRQVPRIASSSHVLCEAV